MSDEPIRNHPTGWPVVTLTYGYGFEVCWFSVNRILELVHQAKLGASCRMQVLVGKGSGRSRVSVTVNHPPVSSVVPLTDSIDCYFSQ